MDFRQRGLFENVATIFPPSHPQMVNHIASTTHLGTQMGQHLFFCYLLWKGFLSHLVARLCWPEGTRIQTFIWKQLTVKFREVFQWLYVSASSDWTSEALAIQIEMCGGKWRQSVCKEIWILKFRIKNLFFTQSYFISATNEQKRSCIHFHTPFSFGEGCGCSNSRRSWNTSVFSNL